MWSWFGSAELPSVLFAGLLLLFHRLFEAEAFAVHLEDLRMMSQAVQQSGRHAFTLEDLAPVTEGEVARDEQTATFVAIGEHLKQQFRPRSTKRQVSEFIDDQEIKFVQTFQHAIQRELFLRFFQLIDQRRGREEFRP